MEAWLGLTSAIVIVSIAAHVVAAMSRDGELARNQGIGIRTKHTQASHDAWRAGHEAAAPILTRAAWLGYGVVAVQAGIAVLWRSVQVAPWHLAVAISGFLLVLVTLALSVRAADRAARAVH